MSTAAYQGEPGAFGEEAVIGYFGDAATPTTQSRILTVFVMLHPTQPGFKDWFRIDHG